METFPRYWPFVSPVNYPNKGQWRPRHNIHNIYDVGSSPALVHGPGRTFTQPHGPQLSPLSRAQHGLRPLGRHSSPGSWSVKKSKWELDVQVFHRSPATNRPLSSGLFMTFCLLHRLGSFSHVLILGLRVQSPIRGQAFLCVGFPGPRHGRVTPGIGPSMIIKTTQLHGYLRTLLHDTINGW